MLDWAPSRQRVSTGIDALDGVLGGLYWGDNVVWQLDAAEVDLFYAAIAELEQEFETRVYVSLGPRTARHSLDGVDVLSAGPGTALAQPGELLQEIYRLCHP